MSNSKLLNKGLTKVSKDFELDEKVLKKEIKNLEKKAFLRLKDNKFRNKLRLLFLTDIKIYSRRISAKQITNNFEILRAVYELFKTVQKESRRRGYPFQTFFDFFNKEEDFYYFTTRKFFYKATGEGLKALDNLILGSLEEEN